MENYIHNEPITLEYMSEVLKSFNESDDKEFLPMRAFSFIVSNENYEPESFSQEIEDSETDMSKERIKYYINGYDVVYGWKNGYSAEQCPDNSDEWKQNHTKNCKAKVEFCKLMLTCSGEKCKRIYNSEEHIQQLKNVVSEYKKEGKEIYGFC